MIQIMRFAAIYRPFGVMRRRRREPRDAAGIGPDAWSPGAEVWRDSGTSGPDGRFPADPGSPRPPSVD